MSAEQSLAALRRVTDVLRAGGTHWDVLGVQRHAPDEALRTAHRQLSILLHPDRAAFRGFPNRAEVDAAFAAVSNAHNTLTNPNKLAEYKQSLLDRQLGRGPATSADKQDVGKQLQLIDELLNRRDWDKAERKIHAVRKSAPGQRKSALELRLGWAVYNNPAHPQTQQMNASKTLWKRVVERDGTGKEYAQACYYLALQARKLGEKEASLGWLEKCLRSNSGHVEAQRLQRLMSRKAPAGKEDSKTFKDTLQRGRSLVRKMFGT